MKINLSQTQLNPTPKLQRSETRSVIIGRSKYYDKIVSALKIYISLVVVFLALVISFGYTIYKTHNQDMYEILQTIMKLFGHVSTNTVLYFIIPIFAGFVILIIAVLATAGDIRKIELSSQ